MNDYVRPTALHADGTVAVLHMGHAGSATPATTADGVLLRCPTCGASSLWPLMGGADPTLAPLLAQIAAAAG